MVLLLCLCLFGTGMDITAFSESSNNDGLYEDYKENIKDTPTPESTSNVSDSGRLDSALLVLKWNWMDEEEYLVYDENTGSWGLGLPGTDEENLVTKQDLEEFLPKEITAFLADGTEKKLNLTWNFGDFPEKGAYEGSYTLEALLPANYTLAETAPVLKVLIQFGQGEIMNLSQDILQKHIITDTVVEPAATTVNLFDYWVDQDGSVGNDLLNSTDWHKNPSGTNIPRRGVYDWNKGINIGRLLLFGDGNIHAGYWNKGAGSGSNYGKNSAGMPGIVESKLDDNGYPVIDTKEMEKSISGHTGISDYQLCGDHIGESDNAVHDSNNPKNISDTVINKWKESGNTASLDYLFTPTDGANKRAYSNVTGLFQLDDMGYYYYNMRENYAEYDETTNKFKLYDAPAVERTDPLSDKSRSIGNFFPFNTGAQVFDEEKDGKLLSSEKIKSTNTNQQYMNHHLGMSIDMDFRQPVNGKINAGAKDNAMTFEFAGDDDVWIFIDDVLVLDLGGIHSEIYGIIDFATGDVYTGQAYDQKGIPEYVSGETPPAMISQTNLKELFEKAGVSSSWHGNTFSSNTDHTLRMFYLERGNYDSSIALRFNLQPQLYQQIKKVDQNGNPISGVDFELYKAERKEDGTYTEMGDCLANLTTDADGIAQFKEKDDKGEDQPFNFADRYSEENIETYILKETKAPAGYRMLPIDVVLKYDPNTTMLTVVNRYTTGAYASFISTITGNDKITYGAYDPNTGNINLDESKPVKPDNQKEGLIVAIPMLRQSNKTTWQAVYGSNTEGFHTVNTGNDTTDADKNLMEWRKAALTAALYQCADNKETTPHWYLNWSDENHRLEGSLSDLPGMASRYQLNNPDGDMRMVYAMIEPAALDELKSSGFANGATSKERYEALGAYIRMQVNNGATLQEAVDNTVEAIMNVSVSDNGSGRGFSLLNVDEFSRNFRSLIYIPNEQRDLRVQKVDQDGKAINGAVFGLYSDEKCSQKVAEGTTANVNGQDGILIFGATVPKESGNTQNGYAEIKWANSSNTQYWLKEISAPEGYEINETVIPIIVGIYSIYADAGTADDGVTVMAGVGRLAQTMTKYASDGNVNITLRDITAFAQTQKSGEFNLNGWNDMKVEGTDVIRAMNLHYGKNAVVDYGLHDEDGGQQLLPFFVTDTGFLRVRVEQNTKALEGEGVYGGAENDINYDRITDDITSLFSLLNTVVVTNQTKQETKTGELTISKEVVGSIKEPNDYSKLFRFKVELKNTDGAPLEGKYYFYGTDKAGYIESGDTIPLHHDESITIVGLPADTRYTVIEEETGDWNVIPSNRMQGGMICENQTAVAKFTNTRENVPAEGSLTIRKTVIDGDIEKGGEFTFTVVLTDAADKPLEGSYHYTGSQTGTITSGENITLKHGQSITIEGLPVGTKYSVTEKLENGWNVLPSGGKSEGFINQGSIAYADFYNTKNTLPPNGNLMIKKQVTGTQGNLTKDFTFQITLTDNAGKELTDSYNYTGAKSGRIKSGDAVTLKHNDSILIMGLPEGTKYQVKETVADGYTVIPSQEKGEIVQSETATASFDNRSGDVLPEEDYGNLVISKTVTGGGDREREFTFTIMLHNEDGVGLQDKFEYDGAKSGVIGNGDSIKLKDGESITIHNLPKKTQYTVTESDNEGYTVAKFGENGEIQDGKTVTAAFQNYIPVPTPEPNTGYGTLAISKVVSGAYGETDRDFIFTVNLLDEKGNIVTGEYSYTGSRSGMLKSGDSITLKHGESIIIGDLPENTEYTVTEQVPESYTVNEVSQNGRIIKGQNQATIFVNTKEDLPYKPDEPNKNAKTGDSSNMTLWVVFIVCLVNVISVVVVTCRRHSQKR